MIKHKVFSVKHPCGNFIGIIAFDGSCISAIDAAVRAFGTAGTYLELTESELAGQRSLPVFIHSINNSIGP